MAYYYVKSNGTATGDAGRFATKQTGTFAALGAASSYVTINAALAATTPPASGDFIVCSELYAFNNGSSVIANAFPATGLGVVCISVNDTAIDSYKFGAKEETNSLIRSAGKVAFIGFTHDTAQSIDASVNSHVTYKDCLLNLTTSNDYIGGTIDGASLLLMDCTIACSHVSNCIALQGGASLEMIGGSITATTTINSLLALSSGRNGGATLRVQGVDLSAVTSTLIVPDAGQTSGDLVNVKIDGCKLASGVAIAPTLANYNQDILVTRSSFTSADAEYQYNKTGYAGIVSDDTAVFRNEDTPFTESNQKVSYKVESNASCSIAMPIYFDFPISRFTTLSLADEDVLTFYITTASALTDNDFYIEVSYPDGTTKQFFNRVTSQNADFFSVGTTLTTDATSTWTGALANLYGITVDTSIDAGADCQPTITVYITKPSVTAYIASDFGVS